VIRNPQNPIFIHLNSKIENTTFPIPNVGLSTKTDFCSRLSLELLTLERKYLMIFFKNQKLNWIINKKLSCNPLLVKMFLKFDEQSADACNIAQCFFGVFQRLVFVCKQDWQFVLIEFVNTSFDVLAQYE
jgi:hypothetical protein